MNDNIDDPTLDIDFLDDFLFADGCLDGSFTVE